MRRLVLASTSPYRKQLLERLQIPFTVCDPGFDEAAHPLEAPDELVMRCAAGKAQAVAATLASEREPVLVIGSDQVVVLGEEILGKPHDHATAVAQLTRCSGRWVSFLTAVTVIDTATHDSESAIERYEVGFRDLTPAEIEAYLRADTPYDCAGSIRAEGLGVALFSHMRGSDFTALIGLPLITLSAMLRRHGIDPLGSTM